MPRHRNCSSRTPTDNLTPEEEQQLYAYYGLDSGDGYARRAEDRDVGDSVAPRSDAMADYGRSDRDDTTVGRDVSGPATDDAMTLSEEQVRVGTQTEEVGRARLRKYVVTENVTQTVPVTREEVRVEREPITEANRDEALSGPDLSEEEHEVVLHEERPVVEKQAVPVERVRLDTDTVTDQVTVSEEVRKEDLDTDLDGGVDRGTNPRRTDRPGR